MAIFKGFNPNVIQSETVLGNSLGANYIDRYLMNNTGSLGGPNEFAEDEFIIFQKILLLTLA